MKKWTHSLPAKIIAIFLTTLIAAGTILSAVGAGVMVSKDFYTQSEESLRSALYRSLLSEQSQEVFEHYRWGELETYLPASPNYYYEIHRQGGEQLGGNYTGQPTQLSMENTYYWSEENGYYYGKDLVEADSVVVITGYLAETLTGTDRFTVFGSWLHWFYSMRYWIFILAASGLLLLAALLVFLFCSAGYRAGVEGPVLNPLDRIPFDLLTLALALIFSLEVGVANALGNGPGLFFWILFGVIDFLLLLAFSMSFATRLKVGGLIRRTLIGRILLFSGRKIREGWEKFKFLAGNLPLVWKTGIGLAVLSFGELFILAIVWDRGALLLWWVLEKLVLIPLILYIAIALRKLQLGGQKLAEGGLSERVETERLVGDFKAFGETLNSINDGMNHAVEERMKSERFKTELITNVSHDIKTPLTSIINYVDLIKKEEPENEKLRQYVEVLDRQSARLKKLIEDLVEASKASTGNLPVHLAPCNVGVLLTQMAGEYDERFQLSALELVLHQPEEPVLVEADGRHFWRILDNLMVNICKYAQSHTRVYLDLIATSEEALIIFRNISKAPLNISGEELMERFVRGDSSRNTEGSGLGLSIARSLCELQGAELLLSVDGDLFKVTLRFQRLKPADGQN